jgi:predicted anti-sigma-YlaC factor YlaD
MRRLLQATLVLAVLLTLPACSVRRMGFERMADAVSATSSTFARDTDPEFVRLAAPATLKMVEMLLEDAPRHRGLLMTACSGFTQYAYAFLQAPGEVDHDPDSPDARELRRRAAAMFDRARDYCVRALTDSRKTAAAGATDILADLKTTPADVPALYWTAVAYGASLNLAENPLVRLRELVTVRMLLARALELDEDWEQGTLHEAMIAVDGLPALAGGSPARARAHFDRAVALSGGQSAFAYVTMATSVSLPARNRAEFEKMLKAALAVDVNRRPAWRLANIVAQRRARALLARIDQLFKK